MTSIVLRELKKRIFFPKSGAGYTLIEILVALTIIGIIFGFGYVAFRDFSRRQAIAGAGKLLLGDLRLAQQQALSGQKQKPEDANCTGSFSLSGYFFSVVSENEYKIIPSCTGPQAPGGTKDVFLPSGITISAPSPNPILFKVLGQGTNIPDGTDSVITLTQDGTLNTYSVTIGSGGEIQ